MQGASVEKIQGCHLVNLGSQDPAVRLVDFVADAGKRPEQNARLPEVQGPIVVSGFGKAEAGELFEG